MLLIPGMEEQDNGLIRINEGQIREQLTRLDIHHDAIHGIIEDVILVLQRGTNRKVHPLVDGEHSRGWYNRIPSEINGPCTNTLAA